MPKVWRGERDQGSNGRGGERDQGRNGRGNGRGGEMFSAMQKLMKMILCEGDLAEAECSKGEDFAKAKDVCD